MNVVLLPPPEAAPTTLAQTGVHAPAPGSELVPVAHLGQEPAAAPEYVPAAQTLQVLEPAVENSPATQLVHAAAEAPE